MVNKRVNRLGWFLGIMLMAMTIATAAQAQYNAAGNFATESPAISRSVRALGMGNAFIAIEGNPYSPFYNPAGLNDLDKTHFSILSPTAEVSANSFGVVGDLKDLIDDLDTATSDAGKVAVLDQFVQQRFGEFNAARLQINIFNLARHNFAAGALFEQRIQFAFRDQSLPKFEVLDITDLVFYASGAYGFWDKLLQVGLTVKPMLRSSINESITSTTALNDEVDDVFQTLLFPHLGIGFDLGLKSDLAFPGLMQSDTYKKWHEYLQPAVALTWQDIGNTPFKIDLRSTDGLEDGVEDPTKFVNATSSSPVDNEQSVSLGAKVSPKIAFLGTNFAVDFRDLNQDRDFMSKVHVGAEAIFPTILSLRVGYSQGYFSGGIGADLWIARLDFATYAEEVGVFGQQDNNRRYALSLNFGI